RFDSSDKIAQQLVGLQVRGRGIDYINTRNERVEAVTIEDAKRVAGRIWANPLLTVLVGKVGNAEAE
ncbi:MAG: insulinase family protein, partial [Rhizobiales bacterium]|nr:insulinase family protein [Hyphomicrobiales bacterium]